jgi:hypothetical protein
VLTVVDVIRDAVVADVAVAPVVGALDQQDVLRAWEETLSYIQRSHATLTCHAHLIHAVNQTLEAATGRRGGVDILLVEGVATVRATRDVHGSTHAVEADLAVDVGAVQHHGTATTNEPCEADGTLAISGDLISGRCGQGCVCGWQLTL